ncbi:MAG: 2-amino-4-hydroxy-6-hydroxymethyldihydropteridine diphosphokinase [Dokdonella sp.]
MTLAYVGLGSNLDDPQQQVTAAITALDELPSTRLTRRSSLYRSAPWGLVDQPDFVNAVAEVDTELDASSLLAQLLELELRLGRRRDGLRWGPRRIDLDLLMHGDEATISTELQLPHPRIGERAFVLMPLAELAPDLELAGIGVITERLRHIDTSQCSRIGQ